MREAGELLREREIVTSKGGERLAISVKGNITGRGADTIIIDDPKDASNVGSEVMRTAVNDWLDKTLSTRLNNPNTGQIVLVMQRLSVNDPASHLSEQENWQKLVLPAIATKDEDIPIGKGLVHHPNKGDVLLPSLMNFEQLQIQERKMGRAAFAAQYQQDPLPEGGRLINLSDFKRFTEPPARWDARFYSVDPASGSDSGSYSVILSLRISDGKLYLIDCYRKRARFPELLNLLLGVYRNRRIEHLVIEKISNGIALLEAIDQKIQEETSDIAHWRDFLKPVKPSKSKLIRMEKAMVQVEQGRVFFAIAGFVARDL